MNTNKKFDGTEENGRRNSGSCKESSRRLRKDERAVSPVIGIILMIAITVVIAAVVAAFAYGLIGNVDTAPSAALVVDGAQDGKPEFTVLHHGGEIITQAFRENVQDDSCWDEMEVKLNGRTLTFADGRVDEIFLNGTPSVESPAGTATGWGTTVFAPGDEVKITLDNSTSPPLTLKSGDTIAVVFVPSGDIMQRVTVP